MHVQEDTGHRIREHTTPKQKGERQRVSRQCDYTIAVNIRCLPGQAMVDVRPQQVVDDGGCTALHQRVVVANEILHRSLVPKQHTLQPRCVLHYCRVITVAVGESAF